MNFSRLIRYKSLFFFCVQVLWSGLPGAALGAGGLGEASTETHHEHGGAAYGRGHGGGHLRPERREHAHAPSDAPVRPAGRPADPGVIRLNDFFVFTSAGVSTRRVDELFLSSARRDVQLFHTAVLFIRRYIVLVFYRDAFIDDNLQISVATKTPKHNCYLRRLTYGGFYLRI